MQTLLLQEGDSVAMRLSVPVVALAVVVFYESSTLTRNPRSKNSVCNAGILAAAMPVDQNQTNASGMSSGVCEGFAEFDRLQVLEPNSRCLGQLTLRDCCDAKLVGNRTGVYWLAAGGSGQRRRGMCDMQTRGGGWLVIARRINPQNKPRRFVRSWRQYERGFGQLDLNFWWGLEAMHEMSSAAETEVLVELRVNRTNRWDYVHYNSFHVGGPETNYTLTLGGYSETNSTLDDAWSINSGNMFSTYDRDNDGVDHIFCANLEGPEPDPECGWWWGGGYYRCGQTLPLGKPRISWHQRNIPTRTDYIVFQMKIRPKHFPCVQP